MINFSKGVKMYEIQVLLGDANFIVKENVIKFKSSNVWVNTAHFHADYEIHIVFNGNAIIEIDGEEVELKGGEVCFISPKSSHYPKRASKDLYRTDFSFNLTRNYVNNAIKDFSEFKYYDNIFKSVKGHFILSDPKLVDIAKDILGIENSQLNEHVLQTEYASFLIKLAKLIKENNYLNDNQTISDYYENKNSVKQRRIVEVFFQKRYNEQVGIEDLSEALCLSVPQTHRIVKKIFGVGFKKILTKQRIAHACMLIKSKGVNLNEVAYLSGYTSYNGFLSAFKNYVGKSPKEYEKSIN
jgi:AraC-like DNA-binding protein